MKLTLMPNVNTNEIICLILQLTLVEDMAVLALDLLALLSPAAGRDLLLIILPLFLAEDAEVNDPVLEDVFRVLPSFLAAGLPLVKEAGFPLPTLAGLILLEVEQMLV